MRTKPILTFVVLLALLLAAGPVAAEEEGPTGGAAPPFSAEEAARLVGAAVSCGVRDLDEAVRRGAKLLLDDVRFTQKPNLTLLAYRLGGEGRLNEADFRLLTNDLRAVARAMFPEPRNPPRRWPRHLRASIAHPEYMVETSVDTMTGEAATGAVRVRAPGAFEGRVHYEASLRGGDWTIVAVSFPASGVRLTRGLWGWRLDSSEELSSPTPLRGTLLALPTISTVGEEPTTLRIVVSVTREGEIRIQGEKTPLDLTGLRDRLDMLVSDPSWREADRFSRVNVLLDVDASIPFVVVPSLLRVFAEPRLSLYRIWLGARAASGEAGALALYLPKAKDSGLRPGQEAAAEKVHRLVLKATSPADATPPGTLLARLREPPLSAWAETPVELQVDAEPAGVSHGSVMRVLDALCRAGMEEVWIVPSPPPPDDVARDPAAFAAHLRSLRRPQVGVRIALDGTPLNPAPEDAPDVSPGTRVEGPLGFGLP